MYLNGKEMRPYIQGALDGLCAIYSIVNAARIISDIGDEESKNLFKKILTYLENSEDLSRVLTEGIGLTTVGSILRDVANGRIHDRNMPFKHRPETSLDELWSEMMSFLDGGITGINSNFSPERNESKPLVASFLPPYPSK